MKTTKSFFMNGLLCAIGLCFSNCGGTVDPNVHMKGFPSGRSEFQTNGRIVKKYTFHVTQASTIGIKSDQMLPDNYNTAAVLYNKMK